MIASATSLEQRTSSSGLSGAAAGGAGSGSGGAAASARLEGDEGSTTGGAANRAEPGPSADRRRAAGDRRASCFATVEAREGLGEGRTDFERASAIKSPQSSNCLASTTTRSTEGAAPASQSSRSTRSAPATGGESFSGSASSASTISIVSDIARRREQVRVNFEVFVSSEVSSGAHDAHAHSFSEGGAEARARHDGSAYDDCCATPTNDSLAFHCTAVRHKLNGARSVGTQRSRPFPCATPPAPRLRAPQPAASTSRRVARAAAAAQRRHARHSQEPERGCLARRCPARRSKRRGAREAAGRTGGAKAVSPAEGGPPSLGMFSPRRLKQGHCGQKRQRSRNR